MLVLLMLLKDVEIMRKKALSFAKFLFVFVIFTVLLNVIMSPGDRLVFCSKEIRIKRIRQLEFAGTVLQNYMYFDNGIKNKLVVKLDSFEYHGNFITYKEFYRPKGFDLICDSYLWVKDSTIMVLQGKQFKCLDNGRIYSILGDSKIYLEYKKGKYKAYQ